MTNYTDIPGIDLAQPGEVVPGYLEATPPAPRGPAYSCFITTPSGWASGNKQDYAKYMDQLNWSITQQFSRQADTATIYLIDSHLPGVLNFTIPTASTIELVDNTTGAVLFGGIVTVPKFKWDGPLLTRWELDCTGYAYYLTKAVVTQGTGAFVNQTVDDIVLSLATAGGATVPAPYDSFYGVLALSAAAGGYVQAGPNIDLYDADNKTIQTCYNELAQIAAGLSGTPWGWYVDETRHLHFFDTSNAVLSGVTITTDPNIGGTSVGHMAYDSQFDYEWGGGDIRNTIELSGISTSNQRVDTWNGDGNTTQWVMSFPISSSSTNAPTLTVNGISQTLEIYANMVSTDQFILVQNTDGAWTLEVNTGVGTIPPSGQAIVLTYEYEASYNTTSEAPYLYLGNNPYDGPNRGVYQEFVSNSSMTSLSTIHAYGDREWGEYGWAQETINFDTTEDFTGHFRAGQIITVDHFLVPDSQRNFNPGITAPFLVTSLTINPSSHGAGYRVYQVTGIRIISSQVQGGLRAYTFLDLIYQLDGQSSSTGTTGTSGTVNVTVSTNEGLILDATYTFTIGDNPTWDHGRWGLVMAA